MTQKVGQIWNSLPLKDETWKTILSVRARQIIRGELLILPDYFDSWDLIFQVAFYFGGINSAAFCLKSLSFQGNCEISTF